MFKNFENKYVGKRCFIIGSGPSLTKENLSLLKNEKIFIVNRAYKALQLGLPHYDFHVCVDKEFMKKTIRKFRITQNSQDFIIMLS